MMAGMYLMGFVPSMLANINVFLQLVHVVFFCFCYSFITLLNVSIVFLICFLRVSERVFSYFSVGSLKDFCDVANFFLMSCIDMYIYLLLIPHK